MGGTAPSKEGAGAARGKENAFTPKEMYNLKQAYYFLCLHTTTLTSCPLDHNQFHSLFASQKRYKALWRTLFNAIDTMRDNVIDFEEFLAFVTHLKRGDVYDRRMLCFRIFDGDCDGYVERQDVRRITESRIRNQQRSPWQSAAATEADADEECARFFGLVDEDQDGKFDFDDFDNYCSVYGDMVVDQTLRVFDGMFDTAIEETGISITNTDVRNSRPHMDWQDQKIRMGALFCCGSQAPVFTKAPPAAI